MKRMLEGAGSTYERGLLDALRDERPSAELQQRMRVALGLGPVPSIPPPAAPPIAAGKAGLGGMSYVAAGTVVAVLAVGGGLLLGRGNPASNAPSAPAPHAPVAEPAAPSPEPATAPETNRPEPAVTETDSPKPRVAPHPGAAAGAQSQSLREEIQLIDSARVAVKEHDSARAAKLLDQYARRFPAGTFREEARLLRKEALRNSRPGPQ